MIRNRMLSKDFFRSLILIGQQEINGFYQASVDPRTDRMELMGRYQSELLNGAFVRSIGKIGLRVCAGIEKRRARK